MPTYSIILPVYNEQENIPTIYQRVTSVLTNLKKDYEIIFIDDGSYDKTSSLIDNLHKKDAHVKTIHFSRNFGHQAAVTAGLDFSQGAMVAILDADLQDPPEILPQFFKKLEEDYDVVYAVREKRKEGIAKRASYALFYQLLSRMASISIPLDSGDFCVMKRCVVDTMKRMPERNRFVRGLRSWAGFRQVGMSYERAERFAGKPQYTFKKLVKLALDGILSFSYVPLRFLTLAGFITFIVSILGSFFAVYLRFFTDIFVPGFATTVILIMFSGGLNMLAVGILGEYVARIYDEVKSRPPYVIASKQGISE